MDAQATLRVGDRAYEIFRLDALQEQWDVDRLPYTLRVLLENVLRAGDNEDAEAIAGWVATDAPSARDLLPPEPRPPSGLHRRPGDRRPGGDAERDAGPRRQGDEINPVIPAELVIDHSVQVDEFATKLAFSRNVELEFERNRERYAFLRWGQGAFADFKVVPPGTGIVHQVNLEYLARVVESRNGAGVPGHARRHRLAHDDGQRPRRARLGRRRDRGRGGDARRAAVDARPAGRRLPVHRRVA